MKRFFCFLVLAIVFANFSFGLVKIKPKGETIQYSAKEHAAANLWKISEPLNREALESTHGIIYPGQWLVFAFPTKNDLYPLQTVQDDYPLKMAKKVLVSNPMDYANANELPILPENPKAEPSIPPAKEQMFPDWLVMALILLVIAILVWLFIRAGRNWRNSNPVTSGPAQIPGGIIHDRDVAAVMASRYPNCQILSITKGKLYGRGVAHYNFNRLSMNAILNDMFGKNFNGQVGYQARIINPAGQEMLVQTLMGCGNEIRMNGKFMTGLDFIPDQEQPEVLPQQPVEVIVPTQKEEVKQEEPKPAETSTESELYKTISAHNLLADEFLKTQTAHKVTLKVTTPQGTVETILETKNETKKSDEEKKG